MKNLLRLAPFLCAAPTLAASTTWVVDDDGGPGIDFLEIQPAIEAAAPGDLVLVHPGSYGSFVLDKGLTIEAVTLGTVLSRPVLADPFPISPAVSGVPAGETAVVRGLVFISLNERGSYRFRGEALLVGDNAGTVIVEQVVARGNSNWDDGVRVSASADVLFLGCKLLGADGDTHFAGSLADDVSLPGAGARVFDSSVVFQGCGLLGGRAKSATVSAYGGTRSTVGGNGLEVSGGTVALIGTLALGRQGGAGGTAPQPPQCRGPSNGGDGAVVTGGGTLLHVGSFFVGGAAGVHHDRFGICDRSADPGLAVRILDGTVDPPPNVRPAPAALRFAPGSIAGSSSRVP